MAGPAAGSGPRESPSRRCRDPLGPPASRGLRPPLPGREAGGSGRRSARATGPPCAPAAGPRAADNPSRRQRATPLARAGRSARPAVPCPAPPLDADALNRFSDGVPRPTINDVARAAGVSKGAVSFAFNNRPGRRPRDPGPDPRGRPRAGLDPELAGPRAVGLPGARRRARDRPPARDAARGPVLPVVHRRRGERARPARVRAAAPGGARARGGAAELPPAQRPGPRRRRPRHRPPRRRRPPRAARRAGAARRDRRARPCRRPTGPRSASTTAPGSPRPSSTWWPSATPGSPMSPARARWCTAGPAARRGRPPCSAADLPEGPCVEADFSAEAGAAATRELLDLAEPPTAIVYANDLMAIAGLAVAVSRGIDVPGQLSITGYEDTELAAHVQPPLTTVSTDVIGWGRGRRRPAARADRAAPRHRRAAALTRARRPGFDRPRPRTGQPHELIAPTPAVSRMEMYMRTKLATATLTLLALGATAACGGGSGDAGDAASSTGPIKIWLSNNPEELAWGEQMVKAWNADHPDEEITAQEIPAGKTSEEVIGAAITAGNAPCLVFNTSPAAVPQFEKQGGLVALDTFDGGADYVEARSGDVGRAVQVAGRAVLPDPVEVEPGDDLLQQGHHEEGRDRPGEPAAGHVRRVPRRPAARSSRAAPPTRRSGRPRRASSSSPGSTSTRCTPPSPAAQQLVEDGEATFDSDEGKAVADLWATMYAEGLSPKEKYNGDSFADGKAAMAIVGPWAIAVYGDAVNWGAVPVPTSDGHRTRGDLHLLRRQEHRPLLGLREPEDRLRGAEVRDQRGAGRQAAGADRPDAAAHRPARRRTPTTSRSTRTTTQFADQASAHRRGAERPELDRDLAGASATSSRPR